VGLSAAALIFVNNLEPSQYLFYHCAISSSNALAKGVCWASNTTNLASLQNTSSVLAVFPTSILAKGAHRVGRASCPFRGRTTTGRGSNLRRGSTFFFWCSVRLWIFKRPCKRGLLSFWRTLTYFYVRRALISSSGWVSLVSYPCGVVCSGDSSARKV
jgi:hypothetical protein